MRKILTSVLLITAVLSLLSLSNAKQDLFIFHEVNPKEGKLKLYHKNETGENFRSLKKLRAHLMANGQEMKFAMNAGMYLEDRSPQGLFIENGQVIKKMNNVQEAYGNFYLQPNGVFYLTDDLEAVVIQSSDFQLNNHIHYATQSGPMLVIDGKIHSAFNDGSPNKHIRNGVGILPNGNVLLTISSSPVNLFDFASFFKSKGCKNALYLDGFVSRAFIPEKDWEELDGNFGVIIAEVE